METIFQPQHRKLELYKTSFKIWLENCIAEETLAKQRHYLGEYCRKHLNNTSLKVKPMQGLRVNEIRI